MKCPKCGYTSFDYNEACPRCSKDLTAEREKMNHPSYIPNPPSLLGALTGEPVESKIDLKIENPDDTVGVDQDLALSPEDSQAIEAMEEAFKDSQELEIEIESAPEKAPAPDTSIGEAEEDTSPDLEAIDIEDSEPVEVDTEQAAQGEEDTDIDKTAVFEPLVSDEGSGAIDAGNLPPEEPDTTSGEGTQEIPEKDLPGDLDELTSLVDDLTMEDEDVGAEVDTSGKGEQKKDEDFSLDLESLELDLELEDPKDKSS